MSAFFQEVRFAVRQIRKAPGFSLIVILTMAIGIGANTAMFTVMDAVVLRPLALPDLHRVVVLTEQRADLVICFTCSA
jgi:putative ABC transport system permease protein